MKNRSKGTLVTSLALGMFVSVYLVSASLIGCRTSGNKAESEVKGEVDVSDNFEILPPSGPDNDVVVKFKNGPIGDLRITMANPAKGVGPQPFRAVRSLCRKLNYAGEKGWRALSDEEANQLIAAKFSLVPGYSGVVAWTQKEHAFPESDTDNDYSAVKNGTLYQISRADNSPISQWPAFLVPRDVICVK